MKEVKEKAPIDGGFGARLTFAILFTLGAAVCLILAFVFTPDSELMNDEMKFLIALLFGLAAGFGVYAALSFVGAIAGVKHKWADVLLIVLGVPLCCGLIGLLAVIGGAVGIKDINDPQRIEDRKLKRQENNGFGMRLAFAIIMLFLTVAFFIIRKFAASDEISRIILSIVPIFCLVCAVLAFVCAFVGKKKEWANVLAIILGAVFAVCYGLGVLGIIGGVRGRRPYVQARAEAKAKAQAEREEQERLLAEQAALEKGDGEIQEAAVAAEEEISEYIQPKMGVKGKKAIMITLIISYSLLLLMGILLASVPAMGKMLSGMGICEDISARAYGITIGVMWVALVPSFGYYFATVAPFNLSKKTKIIISAVSVALALIMLAVFFIVIFAAKIDGIAVKEFYEGSDSWFIPASAVFAAVALMICHALMFFKINPAKIKARKPQKSGDGILDMIKYVLANIVYGLLCLLRAILTFKELLPEVFIFVATILLTWLAHFVSFVVAILVIVLLVGVAVMCFAGVISLGYDGSYSEEKATLTVDGKTLTEQSYVIDDRYQKVYKDEYGNEYVSDDGGKTVREYHRFSDN